jgi:hypothetical protein
MAPLFPELPESFEGVSDEDLADLLKGHEVSARLIEEEDEEFTKGLDAEELLTALESGVEQIEKIVAEQERRVKEIEEYEARKEALAERRAAALQAESEVAEPADEPADDADGVPGDAADEVVDVEEAERREDEAKDEPKAEEKLAAENVEEVEQAEVATPAPPARLRRPPAPSADRMPAEVGAVVTAAAGQVGIRGGVALDRMGLADAMKKVAQSVGKPTKSANGIEQRFLVASAQYRFPEDRILAPGELDSNTRKIQKVVPLGIPGVFGNRVLTASGGLCAPLEPIYSMPNFTSSARPVRDALPSFQAERGGVNVPTATYIGDITTAISLITEAEDALGGTFATKSCQDLECPDYTEVAVTVIAHCREYGNLNSRAWPEKIAHENDLTMAAHAATAESYLLSRIKELSLEQEVAQVIGAYADMVRALLRARSQIISVLRMSNEVTFRVLAPEWVTDELAADTASTQFDRFQAQAAMAAHLRQYGFAVSFYKDEVGYPVASGTSQKFAAASDGGDLATWPSTAQVAIFPEGEFIHVDSGTLELGIVRDSTLNRTNDFQIFGESFENVARLGPQQGALWLNMGLCPTGEFPALATAYDCSAG